MIKVSRYGLVSSSSVVESVEYRVSDTGRFVPRLKHRKAVSMIVGSDGISVPVSVYAERTWESCHGVAHLLDKCGKHWMECLSYEPWWADSETEMYYRNTWQHGGQVPMISVMSKEGYVRFVEEFGTEVVVAATSNSLAHMGEETRTLAATMRRVGDSDQMEMINPDYFSSPLRDEAVLLGDDGTGQDISAYMDSERFRALDEDIDVALKRLSRDEHDLKAQSSLERAQKQKTSDVEYHRFKHLERVVS